jgi:hypothetical protein
MVHGDMFWNPDAGVAACEFPKGSHKHINFASALWMSGYDGAGQLHVAAQTYRQDGNDYWPGPLTTTDSINYATSYKWSKIWKVKRSDIVYFQSLGTHTTGNTHPAILTWPGKGNANAAGNAGAALTITEDMAPFVDLNGNGIYEPLLGEYPDILGDQALWWVFNDHGPTHTQSMGRPLGVEVRTMTYGYHRGTIVDNVVYFDYRIVNKSPNTYSNFRFALFDDMDLGYYLDDYVGFDSARRMGITYNGTNDDGLSGGHPANSYGTHIPVVGTTMIVMPGDAGSYYTPVGSYITYNNDGSIIGNPNNDIQFNYYIRGRARNGESMYSLMSAAGHGCQNHDSDHFYFYTGNPSNAGECSECSIGTMPGDRRFVISTNDFTITPGNTQHVVMAMVTTNPDVNNGCPNVNFDNIGVVADTAWNIYHNPPPWQLGVNDMHTGQIRMYPNPAHDKLFIEGIENTSGVEKITLYNSLGQSIAVPMSKKGNTTEEDISNLPNGLYLVVYDCGDSRTIWKFLKQ